MGWCSRSEQRPEATQQKSTTPPLKSLIPLTLRKIARFQIGNCGCVILSFRMDPSTLYPIGFRKIAQGFGVSARRDFICPAVATQMKAQRS
jgi:hypothetical protein